MLEGFEILVLVIFERQMGGLHVMPQLAFDIAVDDPESLTTEIDASGIPLPVQ
jgi:hypothetical protein